LVILCYTLIMDENQPIWISWSRVFQRWGISDGVALVLERAGAFSILAAQVLYLSQPLLSGVISTRSLQSLAQMLENPAEKRAFITFIREAPSSGTSS
jgi:hypothetical protein